MRPGGDHVRRRWYSEINGVQRDYDNPMKAVQVDACTVHTNQLGFPRCSFRRRLSASSGLRVFPLLSAQPLIARLQNHSVALDPFSIPRSTKIFRTTLVGRSFCYHHIFSYRLLTSSPCASIHALRVENRITVIAVLA